MRQTGSMEQSRYRVLLVTRNFPPLVGGMERLLFHVYQELRKSFTVALIGPQGCRDHLHPGTEAAVCPPMPIWKFLIHCQLKTLLLAKRVAPHLIFSGSGVTAPAAVMTGRLLKIPVLCYLHGLDIVADSHIYRSIFLPAIRRVDEIIVNSRHTAQLARQARIFAPANILHPGVTIPPTGFLNGGKAFRDRVKASGRPILLTVGRLTPRKGIVEFIERCLPRILTANRDALYVIIGNEPRDAIGGHGGMARRILDTAGRLGLTGNVLLMQDVDDATLSQAYAAAQLHVFPVVHQPGDVEGFGMVAVEAAAHGLPTVAFAKGGVVDAVREGVSGHLIPPDDYQGLLAMILDHMNAAKIMVSRASCSRFAEGFAWERFGNRLRAICGKVADSKFQLGCAVPCE